MMGNQLSFHLRKIDNVKTKEAVEKELSKYQFYLATTPEEFLPKVTSTYSLVPPTYTNQFHSSTEDVVMKRIDFEQEKKQYFMKIQRAVNRLTARQRMVIVKSYMEEDSIEIYNYEVFNTIGISERTYYRIKEKAFYNLAFSLNVVVFLDEK